MDYSNIPTGLKIQSQIPLNSKEWVKNEATLAYLGVNDNLAFTYHDQLEVLCLAEKTLYIWREVQEGEEDTGLIPLDFTYPLSLPSTYNIDYSGKTYNFFLKEYVTVDNIQNLIKVENVGTGAKVYKGFNTTTNKHEIKSFVSTSGNIKIEDNINVLNLNIFNNQKIIDDFPYTLLETDDKQTLFIDNGSGNVTIEIPDILPNNFCCTIIQEGTGDVTVTATDLKYPSSAQNILKERYSWGLIEKKLGTTTYFLIGNLKVI